MITGFIFDKITKTTFSYLKDIVKEKFLTNINYRFSIKIPLFESQYDFVNDLVLENFKNIFPQNASLEDFEIIEKLLTKNQFLIEQWTNGEKTQSFNSDIIDYDNYEKTEILDQYFKALFYSIQKQKDRNSLPANFRTEQKIETLMAQNEKISTAMEELKTQIPNSDFSHEFEQIKENIELRKFKDARTIAKTIESRISKKEDREIFYKLYFDSYFFDDANQAQGIVYLEKLIEYTSDAEKKEVRKVLLLLLQKKYSQAKEYINELRNKQLSPDVLHYLLQYEIDIYLNEKNFSEAEKIVDEQLKNKPDLLHFKLQILNRSQRFNEAYQLIKNNQVFFSKSNFDRQFDKIGVIYNYYANKFQQLSINSEDIKQVENLIIECQELIKKAEDDCRKRIYLHFYTANLYSFINQNLKAKQELDKIYDLDPESEVLQIRYPLTLNWNKEYEKSLKIVKKQLLKEPENFLFLELYFSALTNFDLAKSIEELQSFQETLETLPIKLMVIDALIRKFLPNDAKKILDILNKKYPNNAFISFAYAKISTETNQIGEAITYLKQALNQQPVKLLLEQILNTLLGIANKEQKKELITECIILINEHYDFDAQIPLFNNNLAYALALLGRTKEAILFAKKIIEIGFMTNYTYHLLANLHLELNNFQKSLLYYDELAKKQTLCQADKIYRAVCCVNLGKYDETLNNLALITTIDIKEPLVLLSQTYNTVGQIEKAFEYAHLAYSKFPNDFFAMENFIQIVLNRPDKNVLPDEKTKKDFQECLHKYSKSDEQNKKIIPLSLPIIEDKEEQAKAFFETLKPFLLNQEQMNVKKEIFSMFTKVNAPISMLENIINHNYLYMWNFVRQNKLLSIPMYEQLSEYKQEFLLKNVESVFIDLPSLVTCAFLEIIDLLPKIYSKITVSQSTVSQVNFVLKEMRLKDLSSFYMCNDHFRNFNQDFIDVDNFDEICKIAECINKFIIKNNVKVENNPTKIVNEIPNIENIITNDKMKFAEKNDFKLAYELNIPVIIENELFRCLFNALPNSPKSISLYVVLQKLHEKELINTDEYFSIINKLYNNNYKILLFTPYYLLWLLQKNDFLITDTLKTDLSIISDSKYAFEYILPIVVTFSMLIRSSEKISAEKIITLDQLIIELLTARKDFDSERFLLNLKKIRDYLQPN